jgi:hypothetical protein
MPKLIISIEASEWTEEGVERHIKWLKNQLSEGDLGDLSTGHADVLSARVKTITGWEVEDDDTKPRVDR